ncbi:MAG: endonuclease III [Planctomycetes bacterium]|nr:endonuclease III [Planctomycetota bacterium]
MRRAERAQRIQAILDQHFPAPAIPLAHADPFTLLVAVLLSAQCTDTRVNRVTPALFARARTPASMAKLPVATIRSLVRSCGLAPQKAKAIAALSRQLVAEHGGAVPRDLAALERLPGVGHKTASVVMAQAFAVPAFPVDTHVHRLAWRWGLSSGRSVVQTERDLVRTFPREHWNTLHLQMVHFGRAHCPAVKHRAEACPICSWAMSRARRRQEARRRGLGGAPR